MLAEELAKDPERSDHNPEGIPERTIRKSQVLEFGPVTFPADEGATAGVRSLTDWYRAPAGRVWTPEARRRVLSAL